MPRKKNNEFSKFRKWKKEEDELLRFLYANRNNIDLGELFLRKPEKVARRASKLGLKKSKDCISSTIAKRRVDYFKTNPRPFGDKNGRWIGGVVEKKDYTHKYIGYEHPKNKKGYIPYQLFIVEKYLETILPKQMIVHHIDFVKKNNKLKNLFLFSKSGDHARYHNKFRNNKIGLLKSNLCTIKKMLKQGEDVVDAVAKASNVKYL